jgi:hypothetical protein
MNDQLIRLIEQEENEFAASPNILKRLPDDSVAELREIRPINVARPMATKISDGSIYELGPQNTNNGFNFGKFWHNKSRRGKQNFGLNDLEVFNELLNVSQVFIYDSELTNLRKFNYIRKSVV